jgi:hypothetical protein
MAKTTKLDAKTLVDKKVAAAKKFDVTGFKKLDRGAALKTNIIASHQRLAVASMYVFLLLQGVNAKEACKELGGYYQKTLETWVRYFKIGKSVGIR